MKKLFFILISLSLIFSNCQQNNPSPNAACCTWNSVLNYNPNVLGVNMCDGSMVYTNSSGDITNIIVQFHSFCTGNDKEYIMSVGINGFGSTITNGMTYTISGTPTNGTPIATFLFYDFNCGAIMPDTYTNSGNFTGINIVNFDVDFANSEVDGTFTLTGDDPLGVLPPKTVVCSFQNMPCQFISLP